MNPGLLLRIAIGTAVVAGPAAPAALPAAPDGFVELREGFEGRNGWFAGPGAGFDRGKGLARTGIGNGWVRNTSGWSGVNSWFKIANNRWNAECTAYAWIRLSRSVTDGYFSIRSGDGATPGPVLGEVKLRGQPTEAYRRYWFNFRSSGGPMLVYVGNWGRAGDPWLQVDDVEIRCNRFTI